MDYGKAARVPSDRGVHPTNGRTRCCGRP